MNYYGSYTGNRKRKTVRRIIIVLICAALIFGLTVLFGNHLKKKAESLGEQDYGGIGREDLFSETETPLIIPPSEGGSGSSVSLQGLCVPLRAPAAEDGATESSFEERLTTASEGYTGVLIPLTGEDGYLLYNSRRASEASRLPQNSAIPDMEELALAVSSAKSRGLCVTALIRSGVDPRMSEDECNEAITADARIAADAAEAGFDEIIICSFVTSSEEITGDSSHVILRYLNQMTQAAGDTKVGLSLPPEVYETATLSPQIELFVSRSVFLAMELTAERSTVEYLGYICENLAGTMSVYNMRMLFAPTNNETASAIAEKLEAVGHMNYLFTAVPAEDDPVSDPAATDTATDTVTEAETAAE